MKVLVLAGDAKERALIQSALDRTKHEVFSAATVGEALGLVESGHPRLVILEEDIEAGERNEFLSRIRAEEHPPIHLLALTTSAQSLADVDDSLPKPFTASDLAARLTFAERFLALGDSLSEAHAQMDSMALYDPLTGQPFPGNVHPTTRICNSPPRMKTQTPNTTEQPTGTTPGTTAPATPTQPRFLAPCLSRHSQPATLARPEREAKCH